MIACPNCGATNPLGKVFCTGCGQKLPASGLVREDMERIGQIAGRRRVAFKIVNIVVTVWLAISLLLALWPHTRPFYEQDPGIGAARRFHRKIELLSEAARKGVGTEFELPSEELNAYLKYGVLGSVRGRNGSVRIERDGIYVRWLMRVFAVDVDDVGGFAPILSFEVRLRPSIRTGRLRVAGVRFGHLSLAWPFRGSVRDLFMGMCRTRPEWKLASQLTVVGCAPGVVTVRTPDGRMSDDAIQSLRESLPLGSRDGAAVEGAGL